MTEETPTPESTDGVSTEAVESQVAEEMAQANPKGQDVEPVIEVAQEVPPKVETPVAQTPSTGEPKRVLPSEFYNKRQISKLQKEISSLKEMMTQMKQTGTPSAPQTNQPPNYEESFYKDPVGTVLKAIQDKIGEAEKKLKNEIFSETEASTQAKAWDSNVQEASRMVISNERAKSNPNFQNDVADIIEHYGLEHLGKINPMQAVEKAIDIYDALLGAGKPKGNPVKKSMAVNTQTAVRSTTEPSEAELVKELQKLQSEIINDPSAARDESVGKRLADISAKLEKLSK